MSDARKMAKYEKALDSRALADLVQVRPDLRAELARRGREAIAAGDSARALLLCVALARCRDPQAAPLLGILLPDLAGVARRLDDDEVLALAGCLAEKRSPLLQGLLGKLDGPAAARARQDVAARYPDEWLELVWGPSSGAGSYPEPPPARLAEVRADSALRGRLAAAARTADGAGRTIPCLHFLFLLVHADATEARPVVERLLGPDRSDRPLAALGEADSRRLAGWADRCAPDLTQPLLRALSDDGFRAAGAGRVGDRLTAWLYLALERDALFLDAIDRLAALGPAAARPAVPAAGDARTALRAAEGRLVQALAAGPVTGPVEDQVRQVLLLSVQAGEPVRDETRARVAGAVAGFTVRGLAAAGTLMGEAPRAEWADGLRAAWLRVDDLDRRRWSAARDGRADREAEAEEALARLLEPAAAAVAVAWAGCAAAAPGLGDPAADEARLDRVCAARREVDRRAAAHDAVVRELVALRGAVGFAPGGWGAAEQAYHAGRQRLRALAEDVGRAQREADAAYQAVRQTLSPGTLLGEALVDGLRYSVGVRQGAAAGLDRLVRGRGLGPGPAGRLAGRLRDAVGADREFRERRVYLPAGATTAEMVRAIGGGLDWMRAMALYRDGAGAAPGADPDHLSEICRLIRRHIPAAGPFFERYPLRLMTLDDRGRILGEYAEDGCRMQFWTEYEPPRGAGPVRRRFLRLDDRTQPNSMGLHAGLFGHPLLVVPVLYHEAMHHGGPGGNPADGIGNEMAVRLREVLFARGLLAELAPADDGELPGYEGRLAAAVEAAGCPGLVFDLLDDYEDDRVLDRHNDGILAEYGHPLDPEEAAGRVQFRVDEWNYRIGVRNVCQEWAPEVEWPLLDTADTRSVSDRLRRLLGARLRQRNVVTPTERDALWGEYAEARRAWDRYRRRPRALRTLAEARDRYAAVLTADQIHQLLARRAPVSRFADLFATGGPNTDPPVAPAGSSPML